MQGRGGRLWPRSAGRFCGDCSPKVVFCVAVHHIILVSVVTTCSKIPPLFFIVVLYLLSWMSLLGACGSCPGGVWMSMSYECPMNVLRIDGVGVRNRPQPEPTDGFRFGVRFRNRPQPEPTVPEFGIDHNQNRRFRSPESTTTRTTARPIRSMISVPQSDNIYVISWCGILEIT